MAEHKRTKQSLNQADEAEPMEIDSGDDQAELPGDDKAIADHELDQVLGDFQAREAIFGTDSDNSDCEQASEMEPIPAGVASAHAAKDIGNSRADEVRDFPERTAQEMPERELSQRKQPRTTSMYGRFWSIIRHGIWLPLTFPRSSRLMGFDFQPKPLRI